MQPLNYAPGTPRFRPQRVVVVLLSAILLGLGVASIPFGRLRQSAEDWWKIRQCEKFSCAGVVVYHAQRKPDDGPGAISFGGGVDDNPPSFRYDFEQAVPEPAEWTQFRQLHNNWVSFNLVALEFHGDVARAIPEDQPLILLHGFQTPDGRHCLLVLRYRTRSGLFAGIVLLDQLPKEKASVPCDVTFVTNPTDDPNFMPAANALCNGWHWRTIEVFGADQFDEEKGTFAFRAVIDGVDWRFGGELQRKTDGKYVIALHQAH